MPEEIRSLIVILVLASAIFFFVRKPVVACSSQNDFVRRRNIWLLLTTAAFVAHNFWLYVGIAIAVLLVSKKSEKYPASLFFFILFVLPVSTVQIPGMGIINFFFELSHLRLLELFILLPCFFKLRRSGAIPFGKTGPDKLIGGYLILTAALYLRDPNVTNAMRYDFYLFIDVFLPYYVMSRSLQDLQAFRDVFASLVIALLVVAMLACFEFAKSWLLYSRVVEVLALGSGGITSYLPRDGLLRALVTAGQPIPLGYLMVIGLGAYFYVQNFITQKWTRRFGLLILAAGLFAPLSRGPWLGAVALIMIFVATGRYALRRMITLGVAGILALSVLSFLPGGEKIINLLPFIGTTENENVSYRENLITNSMIVIQRNLLLGSTDYLNTPEMESMRQGQGIIDIVNSYIKVALDSGIIGLGLFVSFFAVTLYGIFKATFSNPIEDSEERLLGRVLFSILSAILLIIFSVSSITIIPIMYWSVAGLGVAYMQMIRKKAI